MSAIEVLEPRDVPLGGQRAMTVRRTLPARQRSFVGAWCFVDHYGPDDVAATGGMDVAPHPHCGLATVSWLFEGEVEHRDSLGTVAMVLPGEVNLMTAGRGIAHSEQSTARSQRLHGVQLWLALPESARDGASSFVHHEPPVVTPEPGVRAAVFIGSLCGSTSPVPVATPLVGAEVVLEPGAQVVLDVPEEFEMAVLLDQGEVSFAGVDLGPGELAVKASGRHTDSVVRAGRSGARVIVIGGEPFEEEIVMWWNFIGRTHDEVRAAQEEWNRGGRRFGFVDGYVPSTQGRWWIPAPPMPAVRLRPRGRLGRRGDPST